MYNIYMDKDHQGIGVPTASQHTPTENILPIWIPEQTRAQILQLCADAGSDEESRNAFREKFLSYCANFFWNHRHEIHVLIEGEVLASKRVQDEKAVWNSGGDEDGIWIGAGMHTITAGLIAEMIAKKMGLSSAVVHKVGSAGILHDWYKKWEITAVKQVERELSEKDADWKNTLRAEGAARITASLHHSKETDEQKLRDQGISNDVIELAGANLLKDGTGVLTVEKLHERPELAIIAYFDTMLRGTEIIPREVRMEPVFKPQSIWSLFSEGSTQEYGGKTFQQFGEEILPQCFRVMAERMNFLGTEKEFPAFLRKLLIDEVKLS